MKFQKKLKRSWLLAMIGILIYIGILIFCMRYYTEPYHIEITANTKHFEIETGGSECKLSVHIKNNTPNTLSEKANIYCAYRIYDLNGNIVLEGKHLPLKEVKKRKSVDMELEIEAPLFKGEYIIKIDLVEEGVTWFYEKGKENGCEVSLNVQNSYETNILAEIWCNPNLVQHTGNVCYIPITVLNQGTTPIKNSGQTAFFISYHIKTTDGKILLYDGVRTALSETILPNESLEAVCKIDFSNYLLPKGTYLVEVELLQEGITWGSSIGIHPVIIEVNRNQ